MYQNKPDRGKTFHVKSYLFPFFFFQVLFSTVIISIGEGKEGAGIFVVRLLVYLVSVTFCLFSVPLGGMG